MVPQPDQVDTLHHLAQLQVDHHQDPPLHLPCLLHRHVHLRPARIHGQEVHGGVKKKDREILQEMEEEDGKQ